LKTSLLNYILKVQISNYQKQTNNIILYFDETNIIFLRVSLTSVIVTLIKKQNKKVNFILKIYILNLLRD